MRTYTIFIILLSTLMLAGCLGGSSSTSATTGVESAEYLK